MAMEEFFAWQLATHGHGTCIHDNYIERWVGCLTHWVGWLAVGSLGPGWNMDADPVLGPASRGRACHS
jgi:hypothetical protein